MTLEALSLPGGHMVEGETARKPHGVGTGCHGPREEPQECGAVLGGRASAGGGDIRSDGPHTLGQGMGRALPKPCGRQVGWASLKPTLAPSAHIWLLFPGISAEVPTEARPTYLDRVSHRTLPLLWSFPLLLLSPPASLGESSEYALSHQPLQGPSLCPWVAPPSLTLLLLPGTHKGSAFLLPGDTAPRPFPQVGSAEIWAFGLWSAFSRPSTL